MSYATKANMIDRFGEIELVQLTDRAVPPLGVIVDAVLNPALASANATIDPYLATAGYQVPLGTPPAILLDYACDIARYRLYKDQAPELITKRFDDALKFLQAVASGKISLGATQSAAPKSDLAIQFPASPRVFARETE